MSYKIKISIFLLVLQHWSLLLAQTESPCANYTSMGIDVPNTQQQWKDRLECIKYMYKNRNEFSNYLWLIPHRGYWKDAPENTKPAFERAMDMGYPFIECDISFCKDSVWMTKHHLNMVMYDKSTKIPSRLSSHVDGKKVTDFTLCELRPDLCNSDKYVGIGSYQKENDKNDNDQFKSRSDIVEFDCDCDPFKGECQGNCEPVYVLNPYSNEYEPMMTFQETLALMKDKVLINVDKVDDATGKFTVDNSTIYQTNVAPWHLAYKEVENMDMLDQVVFKGKTYQNPSPDHLINLYKDKGVDWGKVIYTPIYYYEDGLTNQEIDKWLAYNNDIDPATGNPKFYCGGFEPNAEDATGNTMYNVLPHIKSKGSNNLGFTHWKAGPVISDDPRIQYRDTWSWYLSQDLDHRPNQLVTDRNEVLKEIYQNLGLFDIPAGSGGSGSISDPSLECNDDGKFCVKMGAWNVAKGDFGTVHQIAQKLVPLNLDILVLVECPKILGYSTENDFVEIVAQYLGMDYWVLGEISSGSSTGWDITHTYQGQYKAILSKTPLSGYKETGLSGSGTWENNTASVLRAQTTIHGNDFAIYAYHAPPTAQGTPVAQSMIFDYVNNVLSNETTANILMMGDFNSNPETSRMQYLMNQGYTSIWADDQLGSGADRIDPYGPGILDYILFKYENGASAIDGYSINAVSNEARYSDHPYIWTQLLFDISPDP